jgi:hypothetical protein
MSNLASRMAIQLTVNQETNSHIKTTLMAHTCLTSYSGIATTHETS